MFKPFIFQSRTQLKLVDVFAPTTETHEKGAGPPLINLHGLTAEQATRAVTQVAPDEVIVFENKLMGLKNGELTQFVTGPLAHQNESQGLQVVWRVPPATDNESGTHTALGTPIFFQPKSVPNSDTNRPEILAAPKRASHNDINEHPMQWLKYWSHEDKMGDGTRRNIQFKIWDRDGTEIHFEIRASKPKGSDTTSLADYRFSRVSTNLEGNLFDVSLGKLTKSKALGIELLRSVGGDDILPVTMTGKVNTAYEDCQITIYFGYTSKAVVGASHATPMQWKINGGINAQTNRPWAENFDHALARLSQFSDDEITFTQYENNVAATLKASIKFDGTQYQFTGPVKEGFAIEADPLGPNPVRSKGPNGVQTVHTLLKTPNDETIEIIRASDGTITYQNVIEYELEDGNWNITELNFFSQVQIVKIQSGRPGLDVIQNNAIITDDYRLHRLSATKLLAEIEGRYFLFHVHDKDEQKLRIFEIDARTFNSVKFPIPSKAKSSFKSEKVCLIPTSNSRELLRRSDHFDNVSVELTGHVAGYEIDPTTPILIEGHFEHGNFIPKPTTLGSPWESNLTGDGNIDWQIINKADGYYLQIAEQGFERLIEVPLTTINKQLIATNDFSQAKADLAAALDIRLMESMLEHIGAWHPPQFEPLAEILQILPFANLDLSHNQTIVQSGTDLEFFKVRLADGQEVALQRHQRKEGVFYRLLSTTQNEVSLLLDGSSQKAPIGIQIKTDETSLVTPLWRGHVHATQEEKWVTTFEDSRVGSAQLKWSSDNNRLYLGLPRRHAGMSIRGQIYRTSYDGYAQADLETELGEHFRIQFSSDLPDMETALLGLSDALISEGQRVPIVSHCIDGNFCKKSGLLYILDFTEGWTEDERQNVPPNLRWQWVIGVKEAKTPGRVFTLGSDLQTFKLRKVSEVMRDVLALKSKKRPTPSPATVESSPISTTHTPVAPPATQANEPQPRRKRRSVFEPSAPATPANLTLTAAVRRVATEAEQHARTQPPSFTPNLKPRIPFKEGLHLLPSGPIRARDGGPVRPVTYHHNDRRRPHKFIKTEVGYVFEDTRDLMRKGYLGDIPEGAKATFSFFGGPVARGDAKPKRPSARHIHGEQNQHGNRSDSFFQSTIQIPMVFNNGEWVPNVDKNLYLEVRNITGELVGDQSKLTSSRDNNSGDHKFSVTTDGARIEIQLRHPDGTPSEGHVLSLFRVPVTAEVPNPSGDGHTHEISDFSPEFGIIFGRALTDNAVATMQSLVNNTGAKEIVQRLAEREQRITTRVVFERSGRRRLAYPQFGQPLYRRSHVHPQGSDKSRVYLLEFYPGYAEGYASERFSKLRVHDGNGLDLELIIRHRDDNPQLVGFRSAGKPKETSAISVETDPTNSSRFIFEGLTNQRQRVTDGKSALREVPFSLQLTARGGEFSVETMQIGDLAFDAEGLNFTPKDWNRGQVLTHRQTKLEEKVAMRTVFSGGVPQKKRDGLEKRDPRYFVPRPYKLSELCGATDSADGNETWIDFVGDTFKEGMITDIPGIIKMRIRWNEIKEIYEPMMNDGKVALKYKDHEGQGRFSSITLLDVRASRTGRTWIITMPSGEDVHFANFYAKDSAIGGKPVPIIWATDQDIPKRIPVIRYMQERGLTEPHISAAVDGLEPNQRHRTYKRDHNIGGQRYRFHWRMIRKPDGKLLNVPAGPVTRLDQDGETDEVLNTDYFRRHRSMQPVIAFNGIWLETKLLTRTIPKTGTNTHAISLLRTLAGPSVYQVDRGDKLVHFGPHHTSARILIDMYTEQEKNFIDVCRLALENAIGPDGSVQPTLVRRRVFDALRGEDFEFVFNVTGQGSANKPMLNLMGVARLSQTGETVTATPIGQQYLEHNGVIYIRLDENQYLGLPKSPRRDFTVSSYGQTLPRELHRSKNWQDLLQVTALFSSEQLESTSADSPDLSRAFYQSRANRLMRRRSLASTYDFPESLIWNMTQSFPTGYSINKCPREILSENERHRLIKLVNERQGFRIETTAIESKYVKRGFAPKSVRVWYQGQKVPANVNRGEYDGRTYLVLGGAFEGVVFYYSMYGVLFEVSHPLLREETIAALGFEPHRINSTLPNSGDEKIAELLSEELKTEMKRQYKIIDDLAIETPEKNRRKRVIKRALLEEAGYYAVRPDSYGRERNTCIFYPDLSLKEGSSELQYTDHPMLSADELMALRQAVDTQLAHNQSARDSLKPNLQKILDQQAALQKMSSIDELLQKAGFLKPDDSRTAPLQNLYDILSTKDETAFDTFIGMIAIETDNQEAFHTKVAQLLVMLLHSHITLEYLQQDNELFDVWNTYLAANGDQTEWFDYLNEMLDFYIEESEVDFEPLLVSTKVKSPSGSSASGHSLKVEQSDIKPRQGVQITKSPFGGGMFGLAITDYD